MNSFGIRDIHKSRHELDRLELANALSKQGNSLLSLISKENV